MTLEDPIRSIAASPTRLWLGAGALLASGLIAAVLGQSPSARRAAAQDDPPRDPRSAALLEPIIAYHARLANSEPKSAEHYRKFADRQMADAVKSLGSAAEYYAYSLTRIQPQDGVTMPDRVAAMGHLNSVGGSFRAWQSNLRDAEWHDHLARHHRVAVDYYERLLASGATELPPLGPELLEARRELQQACVKLYGRPTTLPPEPLKVFLPGYVPVAPPDEDPRRSYVRDGSF